MLIFSFGSHAAPDVPFLFVFVQNFPNLKIQRIIALPQPFGQLFVDGRLGYAKPLGGRPDGGTGFNHVHSQFTGALLHCLFHGIPSDAVLVENLMQKHLTICGLDREDNSG